MDFSISQMDKRHSEGILKNILCNKLSSRIEDLSNPFITLEPNRTPDIYSEDPF